MMKFKQYINEAKKKGKVFWMGDDVDVQYEIEKWADNNWRIRMTNPKVKYAFGSLKKNNREWEAEIKRTKDGVTINFAGLWNRKQDAIEEILNFLYKDR